MLISIPRRLVKDFRTVWQGGVLGVVLLFGIFLAPPAWGQGDSLETQAEVSYAFGERITFRVSFPPEIPVEGVDVFFQTNGDTAVVQAAALSDRVWVYEHDVQARYVQAFGTVTYWFRVTLEGGGVEETGRFSFFYEDNRFEWQTLEGAPFRVHWIAGDAAFAQFVLDTARAGAQQAGAILDAEFPEAVEVYLYGRFEDYKDARDLTGPMWAGGHADPEAGVIVVSLPPGEDQRLEVERKIPHEVAHLMLYRAVGEGFWNLPAWLNEGFASMMERNPNPDYPVLVANAIENGSLISLITLCQPFPRDASGAVLSYAEASSFVQYVQSRYGQEGVRAIVEAYANGAGCEFGTDVEPVNLPLAQLEREWRERALDENLMLSTLKELAPWLVLLGAVAIGPIVVGLSFGRSEKRF